MISPGAGTVIVAGDGDEGGDRDDQVQRVLSRDRGGNLRSRLLVEKHVPLAVNTWGCGSAQIEKGLGGPYVAAVHFTFESAEAMNGALGMPGTADVMADIPNYTTITPVTQTSEIVSG